MQLDTFLQSVGQNSGLNNTQTNIGSWISTSRLMSYLFGAAGIILLFMLITAGYGYIFSRGDPKAVQVAQSRITTSLTGLLLLFASFWIVKLVGQFFGITIFEQIFI